MTTSPKDFLMLDHIPRLITEKDNDKMISAPEMDEVGEVAFE